MARKLWRDMTKRERALYNNAAAKFYAAGYGKTVKPEHLQDVPPERKRSANPRTDPTEHQIQAAVIQWWSMTHQIYGLPNFALFAIPNGANKSMAARMKFKREGLRPGIPDLMLAATKNGAEHGLYLEMKRKDGRLSDEQRNVAAYLKSQGYAAMECKSAEQAIEVIKAYLNGGAR